MLAVGESLAPDLQVIGHGENSGDAIRLHVRDGFVHVVGDDSHQGHVPVIHDDSDGRIGIQAVPHQSRMAVDGTISRNPNFVIDRMLPIVVTNWMFWIPAVTLVYSLPLPLQMPLNIFATAIWGVLVAAVAKQSEKSVPPKAEVTVAGLPEVPAPSPE